MNSSEQAAAILFDARKSGKRLVELPSELHPATLEEAYAIQDAYLRHQGRVGGWKISMAERKEGRFCSAVPESNVVSSPAILPMEEGTAVDIEGEIALRMGRDLPPRSTPYTAAEVEDAIASLHPAIELVASRFVNRKAQPPLVLVADMQSNAAIILGPGVEDWRGTDFATLRMTMMFDGTEAGKADGGASNETVMTALTFLANDASHRHGGLKAGQVIITGARIKPIGLKRGVQADLEVAGVGKVALKLT